MMGGTLDVGVTPLEVKEIVYQVVPYVGIAKMDCFQKYGLVYDQSQL